MRKVEIGPGPKRLGADWETVDCVPHDGIVDHIAVWGSDPLPFANESVDLIHASHVLEHVPWFLTVTALREAWRCLKFGASIEVFVPNLSYMLGCLEGRSCGDQWRKHNPDNDPMTWFNGRLFSYGGPGGSGDPNWHRAAFTPESLRTSLVHAGFSEEMLLPLAEERGHRHGPVSMGVLATKRWENR